MPDVIDGENNVVGHIPKNDLRVSVQIAPWFVTLAEELQIAGSRAMERGVRPDHVYHAIKAGLSEILGDAVIVNTHGRQG